MEPSSKIYVAGHTGLVGSAIVRCLLGRGYENLVLRDRSELDLCDARRTEAFFEKNRPEYVFLAAAKVGGIYANSRAPADFILVNLQIQTNVIDASHRYGVQKLLFLGSSCIYPKLAPQPIREEHLLSGCLEPTNDAYAIAKIAGLLMCQAYVRQHKSRFIAAMPTNLYGPGDNFDLVYSHVLPALIRRFHEAKVQKSTCVEVWGTGSPRREFLYVDDLADALLHMMLHFEPNGRDNFVNVGVGNDITIRELAETVSEIVGFDGEIRWNHSMPDGTPRKLLDVSRLRALGWSPATSLREGIAQTYQWYKTKCVRAYSATEVSQSG